MSDEHGGGPPGLDLGQLMNTAKQMAGKLAASQEELARITVEGSAGGGLVVAEANGRGELLDLRIDPAAAEEQDLDLLRDLILAAVNQALARARETAQQKTRELTGGLPIQIPGLTS